MTAVLWAICMVPIGSDDFCENRLREAERKLFNALAATIERVASQRPCGDNRTSGCPSSVRP